MPLIMHYFIVILTDKLHLKKKITTTQLSRTGNLAVEIKMFFVFFDQTVNMFLSAVGLNLVLIFNLPL